MKLRPDDVSGFFMEESMQRIVATLAALATTIAAAPIQLAQSAEVYRCEVNGKVEFSQDPCSDSAKKIELKPKNSIKPQWREQQASEPSAASQIDTATPRTNGPESNSAYLERKRTERRVYDIKRKIKGLERDRERAFSDRDEKIAEIKNQQKFARNNLAGATWQQSLAQEMTAATAAADSEAASIDRQILLLKSELTNLESKLPQ